MRRKYITLFHTHEGKGDVYRYDKIYRLTGVKYGVPNMMLGTLIPYDSYLTFDKQEGFDLDDVGNRKYQEKTVGTGTMTRIDYTYNNANQLTKEMQGTTTLAEYKYDNNGNMSEKWIGTSQVAGWAYDADNRQTGYTDMVTSANNATYTYDAEGRRISKTVGGVMDKYLYDGSNVICDYD